MRWQDVTIMAGSFIMALALLPSVKGKDKPALSSSLITGTITFIFCICFATLGLWLSASATFLSATMWCILAIQKLKKK